VLGGSASCLGFVMVSQGGAGVGDGAGIAVLLSEGLVLLGAVMIGPIYCIYLPDIGQIYAISACQVHDSQVPDADIVRRVAESTGLTEAGAARVVDDVIAWHTEPVEDFVRRRHAHHQTYGVRNEQIYQLIAAELAARVVAAPHLSTRQLRRIVYG